MSKEKHQDRLIDMLLREELGQENPPDLTEQILSQLPKPVMIWQRPWAWAALIVMVFAVIIVWEWRYGYPSPSAGGAYEVVGGGSVQRAAVLATEAEEAELELGGYCSVKMKPGSRLRIDGGKKTEAVYLMRGKIDCDVERKHGTFDVVTEAGTVSVTGTSFSVRVTKKQEGERSMKNATAKLMLIVAVTTGSVNVHYQGKTYELGAGTQKVFGEEKRKPYYDPGTKGLNWNSVKGFSGQVRGVVKGVGDDGHLKFHIARVVRTWKGSKARKPEALKGNTLNIGPRRENHKTGTGKPVHRHLAYIKTLRKGAEVTLEIYNPKGKEWHLLELDEKQRVMADRYIRAHDRSRERDEREDRRDDRDRVEHDENRPDREREEKHRDREDENDEAHNGIIWGRDGEKKASSDKREERDERHKETDREGGERDDRRDDHEDRRDDREQGHLPEGMHGFQGMLTGKIVKKNRDHFVLKVEKVTKVWKGNKARNPKGVVGREIAIDFAKKTRLSKKHQTTYRKLRAGDKISVEPFHFGGKRLSVVEEFKRIR